MVAVTVQHITVWQTHTNKVLTVINHHKVRYPALSLIKKPMQSCLGLSTIRDAPMISTPNFTWPLAILFLVIIYAVLHALHKMRVTGTDGVAWSICLPVCLSVCLSVCLLVTFVSLAKVAKSIEMPFGGLRWAQKLCITWGPDPLSGRGNFLVLSGPLKSMGMGCIWCELFQKNCWIDRDGVSGITLVDPRNHVLERGQHRSNQFAAARVK